MKIILTIFTVLIFIQQSAICQDWLPIGTQWHYESTSFGKTIPDDVYTIVGKEEISGRDCYKLEKTYLSCDLRPKVEYLYKENKKLYYYEEQINDFLLLHDFSANIGDTIAIPCYEEQKFYLRKDTTFIRIDSTYALRLGTRDFKAMKYSKGYRQMDGSISFYKERGILSNTIVEDIGSLQSFYDFLESGFCDLAYSEPLEYVYIPGEGNYNIRRIISHTEENKTSATAISPNPTIGSILISDIASNVGSISILSTNGKLVLQRTFNAHYKDMRLDLSSYEAGIYYLVISNNEGEAINIRKVCKQI